MVAKPSLGYRAKVPSHDTVTSAFEYTADPIKGSRFVALISPAQDTPTALAAVEAVRRRWPDATHHCWAFRLLDGTSRSSDDGEPGGSAGRPILAQIDGHEVVDVVIVVVRLYGGTKLGVGGLIRAYGGTAGKGLDTAPIITVQAMADLVLVHSYDDTNAVAAVVGGRNLEVVHTTYTSEVRVVLRVDVDDVAAVCVELTDRTRGRAQITDA